MDISRNGFGAKTTSSQNEKQFLQIKTNFQNSARNLFLNERTPVFKIDQATKIPDKKELHSPERKLERMDSLMRVPAHRPSASKYNFDPETRNSITLTQEDLNLSINYPLMNTLRVPFHLNTNSPT
jgi:hypothetical protein